MRGIPRPIWVLNGDTTTVYESCFDAARRLDLEPTYLGQVIAEKRKKGALFFDHRGIRFLLDEPVGVPIRKPAESDPAPRDLWRTVARWRAAHGAGLLAGACTHRLGTYLGGQW